MIFYLIHRLIFEGTATYGGLRHFADIDITYAITFIMLFYSTAASPRWADSPR